MSDTDKQNDLITVCKELLETNRNIILNGAPGTGKTYLAKQIAAKMIGMDYDGESTDNDPIFKEHVRLVQFHPSYDYTDFVEGLRPISADGQIGFKLRDGAFKKFCKSAFPTSRIYALFKDKCTIENTIFANNPFKFEVIGFDENGNIKLKKEQNDYIVGTSILKKAFINSEGINDNWFSNELKNHNEFFTGQKNEMINKYYYVLYQEICKENSRVCKEKPYVFIIDEINRGEISKIFGELFFSIDPGYRGTKGRVDTQYQNLITDDNDCFKDGFYVPENVYIIGTMNDIDRSVESMDFAFRRRFAFKEVQASDTQYMLSELGQDVKNVKKIMTDLNNAITDAGFTSAYHVGASYFLKLKESGYDSDKLWNYHLEGLLKEYLRGREDAEKILNDWKKTVINNDNTTQG